MSSLQTALSDLMDGRLPLALWLAANVLAVAVLARDLVRHNPQTHGLMRWVWILTVFYSGPLGLVVYYYSGRRQIVRDSLWRRAFRSVAHCYSGCGLGEIVGLLIAVGLFALGNTGVSVITFVCAYVMGFAFTIGPLMRDGEPFATAFKDSFVAETTSITVMEVTAIVVDLWLSGAAGISEPRFWTSMLFSLSIGFFAAYPVNVLLIRFGIKAGMGHPGGDH
jgi:hypothetical protein